MALQKTEGFATFETSVKDASAPDAFEDAQGWKNDVEASSLPANAENETGKRGDRGPAKRPAVRIPRRRTSLVNAAALMRASAEEKAGFAAGLEDAAKMEDIYPVFLDREADRPDNHRLKPAKFPDIGQREKAEVVERERRAAKKSAKKTHSVSQMTLAKRLFENVREALYEAAEHFLGFHNLEFALMPLNPVRVLLAYSGGKDSTALLDVAAKLFHEKNQYLIDNLTAVYVNHGLSPNSLAWEEHCREICSQKKISFAVLRVTVRGKGEGVEAAARDARYAALAKYASEKGFDVIMTAHHEDDRIETFLLQWLRGAGPEGLSAFPRGRELKVPTAVEPGDFMKPVNERPLLLVRPWRRVLGSDITRYVKQKRLQHIEDESNDDTHFLRNRIRHDVIPLLDKVRPGFRTAASRSIDLVSEAADVLRSVAKSDLEACRSKVNQNGLSIFRLLELIPARQAWCLRAWMTSEGMRLPSKARLEDVLRQVRETHSDTSLSLRMGNKEIRRWGSDLIIRTVERSAKQGQLLKLSWRGESELPLNGWGGTLEFIPCGDDEPGIGTARLLDEDVVLEVRPKRSMVKLKLWTLRPSKTLKDLYAQAGIPAFERDALPTVFLNDRLIFAAGLGMDVRELDEPVAGEKRVRLRYRPAMTLWNSKALPNYGDLPEAERREREAKVKASNAAMREYESYRIGRGKAADAAKKVLENAVKASVKGAKPKSKARATK